MKATPKVVALTAIADLIEDAWSLDDTTVSDLQQAHSSFYLNLKEIHKQVAAIKEAAQ